MEAVAAEVVIQIQFALTQLRFDADITVFINGRTPAGVFAESVHNGVFDFLRAELCVVEIIGAAMKIDAEGGFERKHRRPVDRTGRFVHLVHIVHLTFMQRQ